MEIQFCSYSVVTIHGAYIVIFSVESVVLLHYYFPKHVCSYYYYYYYYHHHHYNLTSLLLQ